MGQRYFRMKAAGALALVVLTAGCMGSDGDVSRMKASPLGGLPGPSAEEAEAQSPVIGALKARRSVLPEGGPFRQVAAPVLEANSRAAESELKSARLRAEAQSKNWLPTIGPNVSLTSLSDAVASIVMDAVIYAGGRKKAEREFAKADVEVAAVNLAMDTNTRVHTALSLYLRAEEARETAQMLGTALEDMKRFEWIMAERVNGGISDRSDLSVIRHKLARMQADYSTEVETAKASVAELDAMSVQKLGGVSGVSDFELPKGAVRPLEVLLAEAEKSRAVANAKIDRAGFLPTVRASADSSGGGVTGTIAPENPIGLGMGSRLDAIKATEEAAGRRVVQAREETGRQFAKLEAQAEALARQAGEAETLTAQARRNLDLFQQQYDAGQRQVMDVVGVYESYAAQARTRIARKYELARTRLEMARLLGVLADGSEI